MDNSRDGLILVCTREGVVEQVLYDGLELSEHSIVGQPFSSVVLTESLSTVNELIETLQSTESAFDWVLNVRRAGERLFLNTLGYVLDQKLILIGAQSRTLLRELYHHMLTAHHKEMTGASNVVDKERGASTVREQELRTQIDQLTDQLNSLRIEMAHKYVPRAPLADAKSESGLHFPQWFRKRDQLARELQACEEARASLQKSQVLSTLVFQTNPVAMFVSAPGNGRIVEVNAQFEQLLGYSRDEIIGQPSANVFDPATRDAMGKATTMLAGQAGVFDAELALRNKTGAAVDVQLSLAMIDAGDERFVLHSFYDVSERKRMEQMAQLELTQLRDDSARLKPRVKELETELGRAQAQAQEYKSQLGAANEQLNTLRSALQEQQQSVAVQRQTINQLQEREAELRRSEPLNQKVAALESDLHQREERISELYAQVAQLRAEVPFLRRHAEALEREVGERRQAERGWLARLHAWRQEADSREQELREQLGTLPEEFARLSEEFAEAQRHASEWQQQLTSIEDARAALEANLAETHRTIARLRTHSQAPNRELSALNRLSKLSLDAPAAGAMLESTVKQVGELFHADGCYILRWNEQAQRLMPAAAAGLYERIFPSLPFARHELSLNESVLFSGHALRAEGANEGDVSAAATYSTLSLPLVAKGIRYGVLLLTFESAYDFQPEEIERAEAFAYQVAVGLTHLQMQEGWRAQLAEEREQQVQLRELNLALAAGEEISMQQLALQLQRCVGQNLTMLSVGLDALTHDVPVESAPIITMRVNASQKMIAEIGNNVRDVMAELYPLGLDEGGLFESLRMYSAQLSKRSGVRAVVHGERTMSRADPHVEKALFRMAQRTLSAVRPSASAHPLQVTLHDLGDRTRLSIAGDGIALMSAEVDAELFHVRARAAAIGARVSVETDSEQGCEIVVETARAI